MVYIPLFLGENFSEFHHMYAGMQQKFYLNLFIEELGFMQSCVSCMVCIYIQLSMV